MNDRKKGSIFLRAALFPQCFTSLLPSVFFLLSLSLWSISFADSSFFVLTAFCIFCFLLSFLTSSLERPTDLQQEHDRGHLPGSGDLVQRPQRAPGAAHASPARQRQPPGQRPPGHAHCAPHHVHHAHQHLKRQFIRLQ